MDNRLQHSGVKGMKWGVRRYQNKDGSLTPAGKKRYGDKKPEGYTIKKQMKNGQLYNDWRHAKGADKRDAKKKLVEFQKEAAADLKAYREMNGGHISKRKAHYYVTTDTVAGGGRSPSGGRWAVTIPYRTDPNRWGKTILKSAGAVASAFAIREAVPRILNKLTNKKIIDRSLGDAIYKGHTYVIGALAALGPVLLGSELENEVRNRRFNRDVDRIAKQK